MESMKADPYIQLCCLAIVKTLDWECFFQGMFFQRQQQQFIKPKSSAVLIAEVHGFSGPVTVYRKEPDGFGVEIVNDDAYLPTSGKFERNVTL